MSTQVCTKCELEFPVDQFGTYKNRNRVLIYKRCATCRANYKSEHYRKNEEAYKSRAKTHLENNREHHRIRSRKYREDHYEHLSQLAKQRYTSEQGRVANKMRSRKYRENPINRMKEKARGAVNSLVRKGVLSKPSTCMECSKLGKVEAHHDDYSKPLEVLWVCRKCHFRKHTINEGHNSKE